MKSIDINNFVVTEKVKLKERPTKVNLEADKKEIEKELRTVRKKLGKFQDTIYAHGKYAVLVCIQGMDTAGKDSMIREVFKDFNSRGVIVHS
ncbi:MAG: polyphosphate kinase 2 family protein, partial [Bacteroidia bacterium]|nr:polyphosphate kinase 2 family protein [Bacteroidia bacterium]